MFTTVQTIMQLNLFVFSTTVKIDVWNLLHDVNKSLYDFIGVHDSEVRCRIFERLTQIYTVTYRQVHDLWLSSCCE